MQMSHGEADADVAETACDSFDVEAAIEAFAADPSQVSLKLPHMTTGQRKQARKLADQHPEFKCESFGFGAERHLHLFKEAGASLRPAKDAADVSGAEEMPGAMSTGKLEEQRLVMSVGEGPSASRSTSASGSGSRASWSLGDESAADSAPESAAEPGPASAGGQATFVHIEGVGPVDERIVHSMSRGEQALLDVPVHAMCQVRNTFIHIEGVGPVDERVVRSMPHGMFSQYMMEDSAKAARAEARAPAPPVPPRAAPDAPGLSAAAACFVPAAGTTENYSTTGAEAPMVVPADSPVTFETTNPSEQTRLCPGTEVVIEGLLKQPAFNGKSGVVQCFDEGTGRYSILLNMEAGSAHQWAKVKGDNLQLKVPPPPFYPPALELQDCTPPKDPIFGEFAEVPSLPDTPMWGEPAWAASPLKLTALV
jgi:hypothetical protein